MWDSKTSKRQKKAGKKKRGRVLSLSKCDLFFFLSAVTLSDQIPSPAHATDHHTIDFDLACLKSTMQLNLWMSINSGAGKKVLYKIEGRCELPAKRNNSFKEGCLRKLI
ncbi:hypothetical protein P8452_59041 [Trifolium repens]|nr:hypothetical protein P8452_59041 [Trifolium repens]